MATSGDQGRKVSIDLEVNASSIPGTMEQAGQIIKGGTNAIVNDVNNATKSLNNLGGNEAQANLARLSTAFGEVGRVTAKELGESARATNSFVTALKRSAADASSVTQAMVTKAVASQGLDPRLQNEYVTKAIAGLKQLADENAVLAKASSDAASAQQKQTIAAAAAAQQFANFERSAQSARIELLSFGKTAAEKFEIRAKLLGLDKNAATQKIITELREAQAQADAVAANIGSKGVPAMEKMGMSAKAYNAAMRSVPAQITDIVVGLQGGQAPMTVLLQQGGQLKDIFGSAGAAARALGGYVAGLVNPFTVAAAGIGAIAYASYQASEEAKALRDTLIQTGTQGVNSISKLGEIASGLNGVGVSTGLANAALITFISAGAKADESLQAVVKAAIDLERFGGAAIDETAKKYVALAKDPLAEFDKLSLATYRQIEALLEQGRATDAVVLAHRAFIESSAETAKALAANQGPIDTAIDYWKQYGAEVWDTVKALTVAVGLRSMSGNEQRAKLQARRDTYAAQGYDTTKEDAELEYYRRLDEAQKQSAENIAKETELKRILAAFNKQDDAGKRQKELNQGIADYSKLLDAGLISVEKYAEAIRKLSTAGIEKPKAAPKGPTAFATQMAELEKQIALSQKELEIGQKLSDWQKKEAEETAKAASNLKEKKISAAEYQKTLEKTKETVEAMRAAENNSTRNKAQTQYIEDASKMYEDLAKEQAKVQDHYTTLTIAANQYSENLKAQNDLTQLELNMAGQMAPVREIAIGQYRNLLKYKERIRAIDSDTVTTGDQKIALRAKAEADLQIENANLVDNTWKKVSNNINDALTSAFMDAAQNGKNIFDSLGRAIEREFANIVIRPAISAGVSAVTSYAGNAIGSAASSVLGAQGIASVGELQLSASTMETLAAFSEAVPYVAAAVIAYNLLTSGQGPATANTGDVRKTYSGIGALTNTETQVFISNAANATVDAMQKSYFTAIRALGARAADGVQFGYGSNNIDGGKVIVSGQAGGGGKFYGSGEVDPSLLNLVASRAVLGALQGSDLPKYLSDVFNNLSVNDASQEAINAAIEYAGTLKTVRESMIDVGDYTTILRTRVNEGFASLGTSAATFKSDFVDAIEAGLTPDQLAVWRALAVDMNNLSDLTGDYSLKIRSQEDILRERLGLQDQLDELTMTSTQLLAKQRDALDASNQALFDQINAAKQAKEIADGLNKLLEVNASWRDKIDVLTGAKTDLQVARARDLAAATSDTTRELINQYYTQLEIKNAAEAAVQAQKEYAQAVKDANDRIASAVTALNSALSAVDAVRAEGTNAYLTALQKVESAQDRIAQIQLDAQISLAKAANETAAKFGDLASELRDFVDGLTIKPSDSFATALTAALGGDAAAMKALPGLANSAIDAAKAGSGDASSYAIERAKIIAKVSAAAAVAEAESLKTQTVPGTDPLVEAQTALAQAQTDLAAALSVANTIGAPLTASVVDLVAKFTAAQAVATTEAANLQAARDALAAIQANTASTSTTLTAVSTALTAIQTATETTATSFSTGANTTVSFASDDPIRSVFDNIGRTNALLIDGLQIQLTQLLGVGFNDKLESLGAFNSAFIGTYQLQASATGHLETIAANSATLITAAQNTEYQSYLTNVHLLEGLLVKFDRTPYAGGVYATGGAFTNGIVTRPTAFNVGLMGEAGSEAIMPLVNINGSLGVRAAGGEDTASEIRALREENRAQASALVKLMQRHTKLIERWDATGMPEVRVVA